MPLQNYGILACSLEVMMMEESYQIKKKKKDYLDLHLGHEQNLTAKTSLSTAISGEDEGFSHCSRPV